MKDEKKEEYQEDDSLHTKLNFMARAYTVLHNQIVTRNMPGDEAINRIEYMLNQIKKIGERFERDTQERVVFRMPDEFVELIGTMKYIAKHVHDIEKRMDKLEKGDFEHKIKIIVDADNIDRFNNRKKDEDPYHNILEHLPEKNRRIIVHKFGIYGKSKTTKEISYMLGVSSAAVLVNLKKGLRLLRRTSLEDLVKALPDGDLKTAIVG